MKLSLYVAFVALALSAAVAAQSLPVPNVHVQAGDADACAQAVTPCTIWSPQELVKFQRSSYNKGWEHGREALLKELKAQFMAERELNKKNSLRPRLGD